MFGRWVEPAWAKKFATPYYVRIVFGTRQTGKSTLLLRLLPHAAVWLDSSRPPERGAGKLHYLRSKAGAEVDFIIERAGKFTPEEVKWTDNPSLSDARRLRTFLDEHPKQAKHGYVICRCQAPLRLHDKVTALPWFCL